MAGYRTYVIAAVLGLAFVAKLLGYLDASAYDTLLGILAPTGLLTAAVHKILTGWLLAGLVLVAAETPPPPVAEDCTPAYLTIDPTWGGYGFEAILTDPGGRPIWVQGWAFPTWVRCDEARQPLLSLQSPKSPWTLTVTPCR